MKLLSLLEWCVARRVLLARVGLVVLAVVVAADALPFVVDKEHAHTRPEHLPGFWAVFGFVGCVVIIIASKAFGHAGIMTREDYYDE
jgi:Na+/H+ antiporter NhaB